METDELKTYLIKLIVDEKNKDNVINNIKNSDVNDIIFTDNIVKKIIFL